MVSAPTVIQTLTLTRTIHAPIAQIYQSFTMENWATYWLSDEAKLRAREGGHLFFAWKSGYFASGWYTEIIPNERVAFKWRGAGDLAELDVIVSLREESSGASVSLTLERFNPEAAETITREWEKRLDNLKSVLETGVDLRITERVLIGIYPGDFNASIATRLGVPVTQGARITGLIPGLSAAAAGLQNDDVIVEAEGQTLSDDYPVFNVTAKHKPGDVIRIVYYRGAERRQVDLKLLGYPVPEQSASFAALADRLKEMYALYDRDLVALLDSATEEQAAQKPAPAEWSANEVLAHLILHERWAHTYIGQFLQPPDVAGYTCNHSALISAVTAIHVGKAAMLAELRRGWAQTINILNNIPASVGERKSALWWMVFELTSLDNHNKEHVTQIREALKSAGVG